MVNPRRYTVGLLDSGLATLLGRGLIGYLALTLVIAWGYEVWRIRDDRATTIANTTEVLRAISAGIETRIEEIVDGRIGAAVAAANAVIASGSLKRNSKDAIAARLESALAGDDHVDTVFIATPELYAYADTGRLKVEDADALRPQWLAEIFSSNNIASDPQNGSATNATAWVGAPIALQKRDGSGAEKLIPIARKVPNAANDNIWAGALFRVSALDRIYHNMQLDDGVLALVSGSGNFLLRVPAPPDNIAGQPISKSRLFNRVHNQIPDTGLVVENTSPVTQEPWLYSMRRIKNYDMTAVVGKEMRAILAPWHAHTRNSLMALIAITAVFAVITLTLKRMSNVFEQRNSYYRALFDNIAVSIMMSEGDGFVEANATAYRMFGIPAGVSIKGIQPWELSPERQENGELSSELAQKLITRVAIEGQLTFDWIHKRMDTGEPFPAQVNLSSVTSHGRVFFLAIVHDVSELRRAKQELELLNADLEKRVAQRTLELHQAYLNVAAANEELEAFTAAASHDLRSPLSAISGHAGLLETDIKQSRFDQVSRRIERIMRGVERTGEVIDGLLSLARLSRQDLLSKPVDLASMARDTMRDLQAQQPGRALDLVIDIRSKLRADPRLMASLVNNLLSNAWKYTAKRPRARIEFVEEGEVFSIRDNGEGFDMAHAANLFQPFRRLHRADQYPGLGVGLATVARIVKRYGGRIWAQSDPESGTVFYFTLPHAREAANDVAIS